jgi:hypothetical protein
MRLGHPCRRRINAKPTAQQCTQQRRTHAPGRKAVELSRGRDEQHGLAQGADAGAEVASVRRAVGARVFRRFGRAPSAQLSACRDGNERSAARPVGREGRVLLHGGQRAQRAARCGVFAPCRSAGHDFVFTITMQCACCCLPSWDALVSGWRGTSSSACAGRQREPVRAQGAQRH